MRRDYNAESKDNERKYAYSFDYDVMHPYMLKAFSEHFVPGSALELGCFEGAFTQRMVPLFADITCVEASSEAIDAARRKPDLNGVSFVHSTFEEAVLPRTYDNIFLVHVLEHIDDRVGLLEKVRGQWLSEDGVFIVACPNAQAPSRQIAVKMGLIESPRAVTPAEEKHGHRVTYDLGALEKDIRAAGLSVKHRSGVFFKALANYQWDQLMRTDIITPEYMDGCYELGKDYPDLCASIYCVCGKGGGGD